MYAGNFGWSQNLESVLETARLMRDDHRVKFVLVGDGCRKRSLERKASLLGLHNVEFIDHHSPSAMSEVLAKGHLHLVPLTAGAAGCLVPSKVYGILAAGKPFVAMMESDAEVARLASEFEVGFVVPPGDAGRAGENNFGRACGIASSWRRWAIARECSPSRCTIVDSLRSALQNFWKRCFPPHPLPAEATRLRRCPRWKSRGSRRCRSSEPQA